MSDFESHVCLELFSAFDLGVPSSDLERINIWFMAFIPLALHSFPSAAQVPLVLSCLFNPSALPAIFNRSLFRFFVSCDRFRLLCIYGVLGDFEQVIVPVLLYLALWVD